MGPVGSLHRILRHGRAGSTACGAAVSCVRRQALPAAVGSQVVRFQTVRRARFARRVYSERADAFAHAHAHAGSTAGFSPRGYGGSTSRCCAEACGDHAAARAGRASSADDGRADATNKGAHAQADCRSDAGANAQADSFANAEANSAIRLGVECVQEGHPRHAAPYSEPDTGAHAEPIAACNGETAPRGSLSGFAACPHRCAFGSAYNGPNSSPDDGANTADAVTDARAHTERADACTDARAHTAANIYGAPAQAFRWQAAWPYRIAKPPADPGAHAAPDARAQDDCGADASAYVWRAQARRAQRSIPSAHDGPNTGTNESADALPDTRALAANAIADPSPDTRAHATSV